MKTIMVPRLPKVTSFNTPKNVAWLTLLLGVLAHVTPIRAQEPIPEIRKLFLGDDPIEVTLTYDIKKLLKNKYEEEDYWPASFSSKIGEEEFQASIRIQPRGNFRRKNCFMPPLRLNFKKCEQGEMKSWGKVKLVTHCKASKTFEQYVLKEYLSYKMFNVLSDMSFQVRLGRFTYVDSLQKRKPITKWGFLIEQTKHLAERHNAIELEEVVVNTQETNRKFMTLVSVFQYFLGNTDWSVPALHNIKLLKIQDFKENAPYAIPYDFDYSGIVNAPYAIPNESLGIKTVRERLFRGYGRSEAEFQAVYDLFIEKKSELYALVENCKHLEKFHRNEVIQYMDSFYEIVENPKLAKRRIADSSRGR
ncbi:MAG: hypothetical protein AAGA10_03295 [Bacteroidota bacterium]